MEIIPSILTVSPQEIEDKFEQLHGLDLMAQVDFMDGQFVPSNSVAPNDLPSNINSACWEAHLMVDDPKAWSSMLYNKGCSRVYWHVEAMAAGSALPQSQIVEHGLALKLATPLNSLQPYLSSVKSVLLMSIDRPGYQGEKFQDSVYDKIKNFKMQFPDLRVTIDGGVKIEHMRPLFKLGVDNVVIGSAFWQFNDPKTTLAAFRQATL